MEFNLTHHQWPALGKDESNTNQLLQTHDMFAQNEAVQFPYPVLDLGIEFGFDPEACEPSTTATTMEVPSILMNCREEEEDNEQWTDVKTFRKSCKGGLRPSRYMIDTLEGIRCSIKCGGCVFHGHTESKFKLLGGVNKKHRNLHKGKKSWFPIVNKGNVKHLTSVGPFGQACVILDMKNNKTNRKRLQTFYIRNNLDLYTSQTHDENTSHIHDLNTSQTSDKNTSLTEVQDTSHTQDLNISQTHNKNISHTKDQDTSHTKQQNISHTKQQNTSHTKQQNISHTKQQNTSDKKQQNTSHTKQQNTSHTKQQNISHTKQQNTSHTKKQNTSHTKEQNTSHTQDLNISQTNDLNSSHTKKQNKSQTIKTSQTQDLNTSQTNDLNSSHTKKQNTSQTKEHYTSQTQDQNTSHAQDLNTSQTKEQNTLQTKKQNISLTKQKNKSQTKEQNTLYTLKQHCAQVKTQKGSQSQTHNKNTSQSQEQQSSMTLKQNISHSLHTKQSQSQSVTPSHHQNTNQSQSQQTTHLQHQNITRTQQNKTNTFQRNDMQHVNTDNKEKINNEISQLCVCNSTRWQDFGPMIQCEACNQWYHFKCILRRKRRISDSFFEQKSKFICGYENCKFSSSILVVGGRYIPLIKKNDIVNCVSNYIKNSDLLADSKDLSSKKINHVSEIKDIETVESLCFPVTSVVSPLCSDSENSSTPVGICDSPVFPRKVKKNIPDSSLQCDNIPCSPVFPRKVKKIIPDSSLQCDNTLCPSPTLHSMQTISEDDSVPLSTEAISEILGVHVPKDFFVYEKLKSRSFTFDFDPEIFQKLKSNQIKRCFAVNSWQNYFIEGIRNSNKFCVFAFKNHSVSNAKIRSRKINSPIFKAIGTCKFCDCTCKVYLRMYSETLVHVYYTGCIKHDIHEHHSRPLIGEDRENIKKLMKTGEKPLNVYLEKLEKIPATELIAGNIGNIGMNTKKIIQAGVESRQAGRSDPDLITSLLIQKDSNGFIQKVCAHPMYLLYWSDFGLKLYNEKANSNILYWDATGTVVRKSDSNKQFLYYEMSIAHPIEGKMGIPCCAMLSSDQSVTTILDWLRSFRHAEKLKFGYNKAIKFPKIIISDQSMVFIIAALKEFNNEDLPDFLLRAYIIGKGEASVKDTQKTIVHLCKSHFLNSVKRFLRKKEVSISKVKACLFMIGVLMKSNNLCDLKELLFDIILAVSCRQITNEIKPYLQRLISKINSFQVSAYTESDFDPDLFVDDDDYNANRYSEEDYQILGSKSPFKTLTLKIQEKTLSLNLEKSDIKLPANNYYCPIFLDHLIKSVMPLYPLWSSLLLGNLQRFNHIYPSSSDNFPSNTTNSLIENRFRILKFLTLKGHKQFRIDEFSEALRFHTINIQKKSALDCLKTKQKCFTRKRKSDKDSNLKDEAPPQKKNRTLIKENWNKKREQPVYLKNKKIGTYQKPPKRKLVLDNDTVTQSLSDDQYTVQPNADHNYIVPQTGENKVKQISLSCYMADPSLHDINKLRNFGLTCWFNSVVQAYYFSRLADSVMKRNQIISIGDSDTEFIDSACKSITDIWLFMKNNKGKFVPNSLLRNSLVKTCLAVPTFSQDQQQDASEFISHIIAEMSHSLINNLEILLTQECLGCKTIKQRVNNEGHLLLLHIERSLANLSVQTLIDNFFSINDEVKLHCTSCKMLTSHKISKFVQSFPDTLALVLGRYFQDSSGTLRKIHTPVIISSELQFSYLGYDNMSYQFKSAICHKGGSTRTGHYVTIIKSNSKYICCDDSNISEVKNCTLSDIAYVLLYNKTAQPLSKQLKKFIVCLFSTDILKKILKDDMVKYINTEKVQLIESIVTSGLSLDLERVIENDLGLQMNSNMKESELNSLKNVYSLFIDYLLGSDCDNCLHMRNKLFMVSSIEICQCNKCEVLKKKILTSSIITLKNVKFSNKNMFSESLKEQSKFQIADLMCNCGRSPDHTTLFLSLPNVLIFNIEDPKSMILPLTVCLSNKLTCCYPLDSMNFSLKAILCFTGRECKAILKFEDQYVDAETKELFNLKSLKQQDIVYLFYSKSLSVESISNLNESSCCFHEMPEIKCVKSFLAGKNIYVKQVSGVRITKDFYFSLINSNSWLNNDHINVYLECLAMNSFKKVHNVECGWFIQNLFKRAKLDQVKWFINCLESKKEWFQFEYIVIPVNENNMHWTVLVVDIISKKIYYCNSHGSNGNYQYVAFQIWRYLSFEAIMHSNILLHDSEWKLVDYSKQNNFPFQTDSSSCGVYVCAVAKSIIFNCSLPCAPNLRLFRLQMATEISNM